MQVQPELLACDMTVVRGAASSQYASSGAPGASSGGSGLSSGFGDGISCMIAPLVGTVVEVADGSTSHGTRLVRLQSTAINEDVITARG